MNYLALNRPVRAVYATLLLLACSAALYSQSKDWRPVDPEELQTAAPRVEKDADAEAIFWEVRIDDSSASDLSMKHYVRVKIFTERGREQYSKFDIPFTKGLKIKDLAARVIRADGSIVDVKKEDIFEREIVKVSGRKIKAKSFAVPNIEPGVIVEYRYTERFSDSQAAGLRLEFQRDIPIRHLAYYYKPFRGEPQFKTFNFADAKFIKDKGGYYLATRSNVPAFKQEPYMPPDDMVRPWMRLGSSRFSILGILGKMELVKFIRKDQGDMRKAVAEITAGASGDEEKIRRIYEFCQTQIANNTFDPSITEEMREKLPETRSLKDVLKRRSASSAYIDMLFASLAIAGGFEARIAFVGDRSKMLTASMNVDQEFLHAGAIAVKLNGQWKFYNPGAKFVPIGKLIWYEEDSAAELVGEKDLLWLKTPLSDEKFSAIKRTGRFKLLEDGTLEGDVRIEIGGQPAIEYRVDNYDEAPAKLEEQLKADVTRQISTAEVSEISVENLMDASKPLIQSYKVKVPNYAQKTGKRLFLQPNYFEYGVPASFSGSDRKYDIFFRYPWSHNDDIQITWPQAFALDNADAPADVFDRSGILRLSAKISVPKDAHLLQYNRNFHFGAGGSVLFPASVYPTLKQLFDLVHAANSHTITLKQP